jgi:hypothetical protein
LEVQSQNAEVRGRSGSFGTLLFRIAGGPPNLQPVPAKHDVFSPRSELRAEDSGVDRENSELFLQDSTPFRSNPKGMRGSPRSFRKTPGPPGKVRGRMVGSDSGSSGIPRRSGSSRRRHYVVARVPDDLGVFPPKFGVIRSGCQVQAVTRQVVLRITKSLRKLPSESGEIRGAPVCLGDCSVKPQSIPCKTRGHSCPMPCKSGERSRADR